MKRRAPKCFCQATLRADGTCPHRCDPALARPAQRRRIESKHAKIRERESKSHARIDLSVEVVSAAAKRVLPTRLTDPWRAQNVRAFSRWNVSRQTGVQRG